ncbi:UDP-N-acetylglucosamine (GlcNAc):undecaprenyl-phosphate (Und-P) GlcNAc-1-phosphate transferase [Candidatus Termititenax persephonae]|uniref:UDP-N-acetylglucosamine (GlcNAc):undecaprenyl-phosphate (Und-P) GlcNAc-1-phosphate transferase n=1 Tax=Candidatus Termititenax persephonae TaxID=2218525 RepID=A0A388TFP9_9BACT|nr:UDP-N-acetylglucosamine (GlcNAc):undecaprenyl-phosphate (Und-P) GlcNAc-1-phosphate transferase [Candidatus Termititenax persephonae]
MEDFLWPVVVAFVLTLVVVPLVKALAWKLNIVDKPAARKLQAETIPLLGGLGILLPFYISLWFFYEGATNLNLKAVVGCSALIALVGLWDDKYGLTWRAKLAGQLLVSALLVLFFDIKTTFFEWDILNSLFSIGWLTFITNSINLLDNMDGLAAGISAIAAFFFFLLAHQAGQPDLAMFCVLLSACALAFLKYNFSPASVFMGDLGSLFLGFTLGAVAILLQVKEISNWEIVLRHNDFFRQYGYVYECISVLIPLLVLAVPIFDTFLVMVLRTLNGLGIFTPGRDHSSHRLSRMKGFVQRVLDRIILFYIRSADRRKATRQSVLLGIAQARTALILYACAALIGGGALVLSQLSLRALVVFAGAVVVSALFSAHKLAQVLVYRKKI